MEKSKFLSKVIGLYLIIISVAMLIDMPIFTQQIDKLLHDSALMFVTGFFTLIVGLLMVVSHNIWQWHWRVIITVLGWLTLIKGISLIVYPGFIDKTSILFIESVTFAYGAAIFDLVLGAALTYFGYRS